MTYYMRQLRETSTEDLRARIAHLDAIHYFNWSNADQIDHIMYARELERRGS